MNREEEHWLRSMAATIRKLLSSDRDDIAEISRHIWEGNDYLLSVVDDWFKDRNCHFYGVEENGHIVAVGNLRLLEDGQTGWMEGLRVHPEHRGKGFANEITRYLTKEAEHLGVKRIRYTTSDRNEASLKLAKMSGLSEISKMAVFWTENPKQIPPIGNYPPIEKVTPAKAYGLLQASSNIIPYGILTYDWKALDNTLQNLKEIGKTHDFYVALRKAKIDSLSFGYTRWEPDHVQWSFTVYSFGQDGFLSQLSHNVATALKHGFNSIGCVFETRFEKTLNELDWGSAEHWAGHLVLFEKQMHSK